MFFDNLYQLAYAFRYLNCATHALLSLSQCCFFSFHSPECEEKGVQSTNMYSPRLQRLLPLLKTIPHQVQVQQLITRYNIRRRSPTTIPQPKSCGIQVSRPQLLKQIYGARFGGLKRHSTEWETEAASGESWFRFYQPLNTLPDFEWAKQNKLQLHQLNMAQSCLSPSIPVLSDVLKHALAQQSVRLDDNDLTLGQTIQLYTELKRVTHGFTIQDSPSSQQLVDACTFIQPRNYSEYQRLLENVLEFRNQVLAQEFVFKELLHKADFSIQDMEKLHCILFQDVPRIETDLPDSFSKIRSHGSAQVVRSGDLSNNTMVVYPFPREVPALVRRLWDYKQQSLLDDDCQLNPHPLTFCTRFYFSLLRMHPFTCGNGRVGRLLTAVLMMRFKYLPPVFNKLDWVKYDDALIEALRQNKYDKCLQILLENVLETCDGEVQLDSV